MRWTGNSQEADGEYCIEIDVGICSPNYENSIAENSADSSRHFQWMIRMFKKIEKERIYEIIINNLPVGFSIVDKEGVITDFNKVAETITGFAKSEVIGQSHFQVLHGTSAKEACPLLKHALVKREGIVETESTIKNKNGDQIIISVTAFPLIDDEGVFIGGVELFRDITAPKKLARERKNILSMFAHDMKNPLMTSGGFLVRLLSGRVGELTGKQRGYLEIVQDNLGKVENLLTDFLEFSRLETKEYIPRLASYNMAAALARHIEVFKIEAEKKNIHIFFEYPEEPLEKVPADSMMMDRVIINLLSNAIKYSKPGGSITVKLVWSDNDVSVHVSDTGIGIPEENIPYLFDAFFQVSRDAKGSGLGLAITKSIIEAHTGRIWVESAPGVGTTFSFTLPRTRGHD